jgi:hypothetical protein
MDMDRRARRRKDGGRPPGLDLETLNGIAEYGGTILVENRSVPLMRPLNQDVEQIEFDRTLCRAGLRQFVRAVMADEWPEVLEVPDGQDHVLVTEEAPGIRTRLSIAVLFLDPQRN